MKPNKWTVINQPEDGKEYVALLSYLPVKKYSKIPSVIGYSSKIDKQLCRSKGLIGFSFQAELLSKRFWTLSVWEGRDDLNDFVMKLPHRDVMSELVPHLHDTKFIFWQIKEPEIPPDWSKAKTRFEAER